VSTSPAGRFGSLSRWHPRRPTPPVRRPPRRARRRRTPPLAGSASASPRPVSRTSPNLYRSASQGNLVPIQADVLETLAARLGPDEAHALVHALKRRRRGLPCLLGPAGERA